MPKLGAAIVALICWAGLAIQFGATMSQGHSAAATLWIIFRFFTILTNLALALAMTAAVFGGRLPASMLGGLTVAILLVGIVYALLLAGLQDLHGPALTADVLLHKVSPVAMGLYWLFAAPHRRLRWPAPLWWALYPVAYFAYALLRGASDGKYPYPFMDAAKIGYVQTLINAGVIAAFFLVGGLALVALDRLLPSGAKAIR